jgi:hypothetical protein
MELQFRKTETCTSLNSQLQRSFPFLKLVFYRHPHAPGTIRPAVDKLPDTMPLSEMHDFTGEAKVQLNGEDLVMDLEQAINAATGLHVQVFRNQFDRWVATTGTDFETIDQLNSIGLETCNRKIHPDSGLDYREEQEY